MPDLSAVASAAPEQTSPAAPDEDRADGSGPVEPDRDEAGLDVGAPEPLEAEPTASAVVPVTVESVRDDVEEIVVEQALAVERNRRSAPNGHVDAAAQGLSAEQNGTNESGAVRRRNRWVVVGAAA